jgi:threonine dehydrogenase-like Zn-dependent dehydrogenase
MGKAALPNELDPGEVLVQITLVSICGTDLHKT